MKFEFYQPDSKIEFDYEINADTKNKVYGSVLNELFRAVSLQKFTGARLFKLNEPVMIRIESDKFVLDTGDAFKKVQHRLKLNSSSKSKRLFAKKFVAIADYILTKPEALTVKEVVDVLAIEEAVAS